MGSVLRSIGVVEIGVAKLLFRKDIDETGNDKLGHGLIRTRFKLVVKVDGQLSIQVFDQGLPPNA